MRTLNRTVFRLDDSVIAQIVRLIQVGFLSGTDISDHMRQLVMEQSADGLLVLTPEYLEKDARDIEKMLDELNKDSD